MLLSCSWAPKDICFEHDMYAFLCGVVAIVCGSFLECTLDVSINNKTQHARVDHVAAFEREEKADPTEKLLVKQKVHCLASPPYDCRVYKPL